jgi:hypothetical protein
MVFLIKAHDHAASHKLRDASDRRHPKWITRRKEKNKVPPDRSIHLDIDFALSLRPGPGEHWNP